MAELTIAEVHQEELRVLDHFAAFCAEHHLRYSLDFGTLLGAVRHRGFIPWDDDVDVSMPREDCERFRRLHRDTDEFALLHHSTHPRYPLSFPRLVSRRTRVVELSRRQQWREPDMGCWIDIFPYDYYSGDPRDIDDMNRYEAMALRLYRRPGHWLKRVTVPLWTALLNGGRTDLHALLRECDDRARRHPASDRMCKFVSDTHPIVPSAAWDSLGTCEFEGRAFSAFADSDSHLRDLYGDYMTLPPEEKRRTPNWWVVTWR